MTFWLKQGTNRTKSIANYFSCFKLLQNQENGTSLSRQSYAVLGKLVLIMLGGGSGNITIDTLNLFCWTELTTREKLSGSKHRSRHNASSFGGRYNVSVRDSQSLSPQVDGSAVLVGLSPSQYINLDGVSHHNRANRGIRMLFATRRTLWCL